MRTNVLLVGGDSFLGKQITRELDQCGIPCAATTRKPQQQNTQRPLLDLNDTSTFEGFSSYTHAILLAGIWDYQACATDPSAWQVNVINMAKLVGSLLAANCRVSFVSSNTVFGGERAWCNENEQHQPRFPYAKHKSAAELQLKERAKQQNKSDQLNIIRLTKILDLSTSPIPMWINQLENQQPITPFRDLIFAPITRDYAAKSVIKIALANVEGDYHVSGAENIDYQRFAESLARGLGFVQANIQPAISHEKGVNIPFLPKFSGLGMDQTTNKLNIAPQSIEDVVQTLVEQYRADEYHS
jgi:dTDP-4-dehydrorhamnose reductase